MTPPKGRPVEEVSGGTWRSRVNWRNVAITLYVGAVFATGFALGRWSR